MTGDMVLEALGDIDEPVKTGEPFTDAELMLAIEASVESENGYKESLEFLSFLLEEQKARTEALKADLLERMQKAGATYCQSEKGTDFIIDVSKKTIIDEAKAYQLVAERGFIQDLVKFTQGNLKKALGDVAKTCFIVEETPVLKLKGQK